VSATTAEEGSAVASTGTDWKLNFILSVIENRKYAVAEKLCGAGVLFTALGHKP